MGVLIELHLLRNEGIDSLWEAWWRRLSVVDLLLLPSLLLEVQSFLVLFELDLAALESEFEAQEVHGPVGQYLADLPRVNRAAQVQVESLLGRAQLVSRFSVLAVRIGEALAGVMTILCVFINSFTDRDLSSDALIL